MSGRGRTLRRVLGVAAGCCLCAGVPSAAAPAAAAPAAAAPLRVVSDDGYPPYAFRDARGGLQGIVVDQWAAWSRATGVRVELTGTNWAAAQAVMAAGRADVIDTMFRTPERERRYAFTRPWARLAVPVFFHRTVSGIASVTDLRGLRVAVKAGDACIDVLRAAGVDSLREYPSYEAIVAAAACQNERVFCVDAPPANYFLFKLRVDHEFRSALNLYTGEFHRAVDRGRPELLALVQRGFDALPPADLAAIDERWLGAQLSHGHVPWLALAAAAAMVVLLSTLVVVLRRRVRARTADLVASEARYRMLFELESDAILIIDNEEGRIVEANRAACELYGRARDELLALRNADLSAEPEETTKVTKTTAIDPATVIYIPLRWHRRRDGTRFPVEITGRFFEMDGRPVHIVAIRDSTGRLRAQEELAAKTRELERIIYVTSHDLRTPLVTIQGFAGMVGEDVRRLVADAPPPAEAGAVRERLARNLEFLRGGALRIEQLIDALLKVSRTGRLVLVPARCDAAACARQALAAAGFQVREAGADVAIAEDGLPPCLADPAALTQIFANLLDNALKYRDPARPAVVRFAGEVRDGAVVYAVEDNGRGVAPADHERIFEIFERADYGAVAGEGIGLALVRRLAERMGGAVALESAPGAGSRFLVSLPPAPEDVP